MYVSRLHSPVETDALFDAGIMFSDSEESLTEFLEATAKGDGKQLRNIAISEVPPEVVAKMAAMHERRLFWRQARHAAEVVGRVLKAAGEALSWALVAAGMAALLLGVAEIVERYG